METLNYSAFPAGQDARAFFNCLSSGKMEQSGNRIFALRAEKCQKGIFQHLVIG
jgi:hypothetical protein